jgi:hypothetical protein
MSESDKDQNAKALEEARNDVESWPEWYSLSTVCRRWNVGLSRQNCASST